MVEFTVISEWVLLCLTLIIYLTIAVVLFRKYIRTRDRGLIWLVFALAVWPLVSAALHRLEDVALLRAFRGHGPTFFPYSLVVSGQVSAATLSYFLSSIQNFVGVFLVLIAVLQLYGKKSHEIKHTFADVEINNSTGATLLQQ